MADAAVIREREPGWASIAPTTAAPAVVGAWLTLRPWDRRRDRRQQDAWPAPKHPFTRIWTTSEPAPGPRCSWAIVMNGNQQTIGRVTLRDIHDRSARLGIYLSPSWTRRGFGRQALQLFLGMCFEQLHLARLYADVALGNDPALKCYLGQGFECQHTLWRTIAGDDPALELLATPEYRHLRLFFELKHFLPQRCALFLELCLRADQWRA